MMRATELLGCDVYDAEGTHIGNVHDLVFENLGRPGDIGWRCRLTGFACAQIAVGHRLGYGTGEMNGPWLLKTIFTRRHRRSIQFRWSDVAGISRPRIDLSVTRLQLEARS